MWSRKRRPEGATATEAEVHAAAMMLLARRDYCSAELGAKLCERGFEQALVDAVVAELTERRYVDDARYVASYVHHHAERGQGPRRIRQDLGELGLKPELFEATLAGLDWAVKARQLRVRKFGQAVPANWPARAKQLRFLQYRGFSADHIRSALGAIDLETPDD
jgi:regulatory protein